jgi:hypothetical protein
VKRKGDKFWNQRTAGRGQNPPGAMMTEDDFNTRLNRIEGEAQEKLSQAWAWRDLELALLFAASGWRPEGLADYFRRRWGTAVSGEWVVALLSYAREVKR